MLNYSRRAISTV